MPWFEQLLKRLALLLQGFGVPDDKLDVAALGVVYAAAVLVALLIILLLLKIARGGGRRSEVEPVAAPTAEETPEVEPQDEAGGEAGGEAQAAAQAPAEAAFPEETAAAVEEPVAVEAPVEETPAPLNLVERFRAGVARTRSGLVGRIDALLSSGRRIDDDLFEELEEILITADLGMQTTQALMAALERRCREEGLTDASALRLALMAEMERLLLVAPPVEVKAAAGPHVLMVVGVNGVGKTTTIGKLARKFAAQGLKVVLGAGDTFRAAAAEQLVTWGERAGVDVIRHAEGADPGAVAFDAAKAAVARKADLLILDTAGRLHTKVNLMEELKKVRRVLEREIPGAPHQTLLVLDATTGQNALNQARQFNGAVGVDAIALTKLDGTAKGGIVVAISAELGLPVRYVGIGEGVDDLQEFQPGEFVAALFEN